MSLVVQEDIFDLVSTAPLATGKAGSDKVC